MTATDGIILREVDLSQTQVEEIVLEARPVEPTIGTTVDAAVADPESLGRSVGELQRLVDRRG